jgi:hypothetical protein
VANAVMTAVVLLITCPQLIRSISRGERVGTLMVLPGSNLTVRFR